MDWDGWSPILKIFYIFFNFTFRMKPKVYIPIPDDSFSLSSSFFVIDNPESYTFSIILSITFFSLSVNNRFKKISRKVSSLKRSAYLIFGLIFFPLLVAVMVSKSKTVLLKTVSLMNYFLDPQYFPNSFNHIWHERCLILCILPHEWDEKGN